MGSEMCIRDRTKGFVLQVKKQPQADIIRTVKRVRERVDELQKNIPDDINIFYTDDSSEAVANRLEIIIKNGYIGLALVLVVLGAFLSLRTAFWVAVSIPVTLLGTVFGLGLTGNTINLISLSGFILVLGIVCLLYTSPSPRDLSTSRMPSSA